MKFRFLGATAALALTLTACGDGADTGATGNSASSAPALDQVPAPNGGDWTTTVAETPAGGFVMGNPDAPVKVVEYASMTCGACAAFAQNGHKQLVDTYVKSGQVSFELRNFVRDPADIAASLLARCGGATPFYTITDQMFASQAEWLGKLQALPEAEAQRMQAMQPREAAAMLARQAGLVDFVRLRGIPNDRAEACLADQAAFDRLIAMNETASQDEEISATPTFLVNGEVATTGADWAALETAIREAL